MEGIEVNCFICGSNNILYGKCMSCGYECEVKFLCPYFNGSMSCNLTRKLCKNKEDYYNCLIYQKLNHKS